MLKSITERIKSGRLVSEAENEAILDSIFSGAETNKDIKVWLEALADRGETTDDIVGLAESMRAAMTPIPILGETLDVCGTGGSGQDRFNISTASAIVCASMGVPVAKHGNYGSKKPNGSFNFLEALGVPFNHTVEGMQTLFTKHNLCFICARYFHPAMKIVGPIRQEIGFRTVFNLLGPLCNPASNTHHVLGAVSEPIAQRMATSLQRLGIKKALVVVGNDGLDELSATGESVLFELSPKSINRRIWTSPFTNLAPYPCSNSDDNAALFESVVLAGNADHSLSKHIAISAGASLYLMDRCKDIESGITHVLTHIKANGVALFLENYIQSAKALEQ